MGNYHVSAHKARESRKAAQQLLTPRQVQEASDYEHEEILQQSGVPGMGLRVAVSSADLHPHPHPHPHPTLTLTLTLTLILWCAELQADNRRPMLARLLCAQDPYREI